MKVCEKHGNVHLKHSMIPALEDAQFVTLGAGPQALTVCLLCLKEWYHANFAAITSAPESGKAGIDAQPGQSLLTRVQNLVGQPAAHTQDDQVLDTPPIDDVPQIPVAEPVVIVTCHSCQRNTSTPNRDGWGEPDNRWTCKRCQGNRGELTIDEVLEAQHAAEVYPFVSGCAGDMEPRKIAAKCRSYGATEEMPAVNGWLICRDPTDPHCLCPKCRVAAYSVAIAEVGCYTCDAATTTPGHDGWMVFQDPNVGPINMCPACKPERADLLKCNLCDRTTSNPDRDGWSATLHPKLGDVIICQGCRAKAGLEFHCDRCAAHTTDPEGDGFRFMGHDQGWLCPTCQE